MVVVVDPLGSEYMRVRFTSFWALIFTTYFRNPKDEVVTGGGTRQGLVRTGVAGSLFPGRRNRTGVMRRHISDAGVGAAVYEYFPFL
jgi:hypothetical protein